jgi:hypothetical protein
MNIKSEARIESLKIIAFLFLTIFTIFLLISEFGFHWMYLIILPLIPLFIGIYIEIKIGGILCPQCKNIYGVRWTRFGVYVPPKCIYCGSEHRAS